ncbi:MAG: aminopeptidase P family protein [Planctomycetes bacterium]|nr:aminopeptidase P family protein [Planctomycetota bacterium]
MQTRKDSGIFTNRRRTVFGKARSDSGKKLGAVLISRPEDVAYLTGFTGEDSFLLIAGGKGWLLTDSRFTEQAQRECPGLEVFTRKGPMAEGVKEVSRQASLKTIAAQADHLTVNQNKALSKVLRRPLVPLNGLLTRLRGLKDRHEVAAIRRAIAIGEHALGTLIAKGRRAFVGRAERDVAAELEYLMRQGGAEKPAFETIVAAGPHGSMPHYRPGDTKIRPGDAVLIDWGAMVGGYAGDLTRVVFTGKISPQLFRIYDVVLKAQRAGIAALWPGKSCKSAHLAAKKVVEDAGYGDKFLHSLGHGLGRNVHEWPSLSWLSKDRLRAGMVVTAEPGIYLPDVGGVRIEDVVLVTPRGPKVLSAMSRSIKDMTLR